MKNRCHGSLLKTEKLVCSTKLQIIKLQNFSREYVHPTPSLQRLHEKIINFPVSLVGQYMLELPNVYCQRTYATVPGTAEEGGQGGHVPPQYFLNYKELVRKSELCPPNIQSCPPPNLKVALWSLSAVCQGTTFIVS